jgi:signal transduction histidine kinase
VSALPSNPSRFLVVAPVGRDGDLICGLLKGAGYRSEVLHNVEEAGSLESEIVLGIILTDEALLRGGIESLEAIMNAQPSWSDLPAILLTSSGGETVYAAIAGRARAEMHTLILLHRPVRKEMLLSAVQVAHNSRQKQLQVRDAALRQFQSDEALRRSEHLAVAGGLVATMAHEVNNPLEALGNLLYLVENSASLEEARSFGKLAAKEFQRISEIVDHTLKFHRAPAKPAFTDVSELAISALTLFRGKLRQRQIRERIKVERAFGYCCEGEIRQALVNLIGNAVDALRDGGNLRIHVLPVSMNGVEYARLTVADTSGGIREEIRQNLFKQFFTTKGSGGTGLGLWLTRDVVEKNGGRLRFRSRTEAPSGTVFTMYLPAAAGQGADQGRAKEPQNHEYPLAG